MLIDRPRVRGTYLSARFRYQPPPWAPLELLSSSINNPTPSISAGDSRLKKPEVKKKKIKKEKAIALSRFVAIVFD